MSTKILLLSGPNINMFGVREPEVYGYETLTEMVKRAESVAVEAGHELDHFHSNIEGEIVTKIQVSLHNYGAIIINAGALTHYGYSLHDALAMFEGVVVELHVSNPFSREEWRHTSVISDVADVVICGAGGYGYELAARAAVDKMK